MAVKITGEDLKSMRLKIGLSQREVANALSINRSSIAMFEVGRRKISEELAERLIKFYQSVETNEYLEAHFDYMRVCFPTNNHVRVIEEVLKLDYDLFVFKETKLYGYREMYFYGDIRVLNSDPMTDRGVLIELAGQGCRNYEVFLEEWQENWKDFIRRCFQSFQGKVNFPRVDVALDDKKEMISIPFIAQRCNEGLYKTRFRSVRVIDERETGGNTSKGCTIYFGSRQSSMHFCFYQKNLEQAKKLKISPDEVEVKNRYEIRLTNEKAMKFLKAYLLENDFARLIRSIMVDYLLICDWGSNEDEVVVNPQWKKFMKNLVNIDLSMEPKEVTFEKKVNWLKTQVAQTLRAIFEVDNQTGQTILQDIIRETELKQMNQELVEQVVESFQRVYYIEKHGYIYEDGEFVY